jgi:hypothetical protein
MSTEDWMTRFRELSKVENTTPAKLSQALHHARSWYRMRGLDSILPDAGLTVLMAHETLDHLMRDEAHRDPPFGHISFDDRHLPVKYEDADIVIVPGMKGFKIKMSVGFYEPPPGGSRVDLADKIL